jgi:hypothetical protein
MCCKVSVPAHLETTRFRLPALSPLSHRRHQRHTPRRCCTICNFVSFIVFRHFRRLLSLPNARPLAITPLAASFHIAFDPRRHLQVLSRLSSRPSRSPAFPSPSSLFTQVRTTPPLYRAAEPLLVNISAARSYAQHGHGVSSNGLALRLPTFFLMYSYLPTHLLSIDTIPYHF